MVDFEGMITDYILEQLSRATYKILEDGTYFGEIPSLRGVWAQATSLEDCRQELTDVLESWLYLQIQNRKKVPGFRTQKFHPARYAPSRLLA